MPGLNPALHRMRADVVLRMDGNARVLTIPRQMTTYLGWLPGDRFVVELLEDHTVHVRPLTPADFMPSKRASIVYDFTEPESK